MKIGATSHAKDRWLHTHTYQKDGCRQALERAFLDRGSTPLRLGDDIPTVTALAVTVVVKVAGTCKILEMWVSSVVVDRMPSPFFVVRCYRSLVELPRQIG
jgi:hypothetical protein